MKDFVKYYHAYPQYHINPVKLLLALSYLKSLLLFSLSFGPIYIWC